MTSAALWPRVQGGIDTLEGRRNLKDGMREGTTLIVEVGPYVFEFDPRAAVLVTIDMQRDVGVRRSRRVLLHVIIRGKIRQELTLRA